MGEPVDRTALEELLSLESLNEREAKLLYWAGYSSLEALNTAPEVALTEIRGIDAALAHSIRRELDERGFQLPRPVETERIGTVPPEPAEDVTIEWLDQQNVMKEELKTLRDQVAARSWNAKADEFTQRFSQLQRDTQKNGRAGEEEAILDLTELESITPRIAKQLYWAGYPSITALFETTEDELAKIEGLDRSTAKQIKNELSLLFE